MTIKGVLLALLLAGTTYFFWDKMNFFENALVQAQVDAAFAAQVMNEDVMAIREAQNRKDEVRVITKQKEGYYELTLIPGDK